MIASLIIFIAVLIFAAGVLVTGRLSQTVLFLSLAGTAMSLLLFSLGARNAAFAELILGAGLIPFLFHRVMLRLPKEVQDEKRDWVFPFQKNKGKNPLPPALKIFPLSFICFAMLSWIFVPPFFRNVCSFLVKLPQPEPFLRILWETKKLDLFAVFAALAVAAMVIAAEKKHIENNPHPAQRNSKGD